MQKSQKGRKKNNNSQEWRWARLMKMSAPARNMPVHSQWRNPRWIIRNVCDFLFFLLLTLVYWWNLLSRWPGKGFWDPESLQMLTQGAEDVSEWDPRRCVHYLMPISLSIHIFSKNMLEINQLFCTVEAYQFITIHYLLVSSFCYFYLHGQSGSVTVKSVLFSTTFWVFVMTSLVECVGLSHSLCYNHLHSKPPFVFFALVAFIFLLFLFFLRQTITFHFLCSAFAFSIYSALILFLWIDYGYTILLSLFTPHPSSFIEGLLVFYHCTFAILLTSSFIILAALWVVSCRKCPK